MKREATVSVVDIAVDIDSEFLHSIPNRAPGHTQDAGGLRLVASGPCQGFDELLLFQLLPVGR